MATGSGWVATWTELEDTGARARTLVVTDGDQVVFDGAGLQLRDRDDNFAVWNGPHQLYAYSSDVGGRLVSFEPDGSGVVLTSALDEGYCMDLDPRVELSEDRLTLLPRTCG